jgi:hypothetical protein
LRRAARVDDNQEEIVRALRALGAVVVSLAAVGNGCPDLLVGHKGKTLLMEVKDGAKVPSAQQLTPAQKTWHAVWRGSRVEIVRSVNEALVVIGIRVDE